jgi:hypothetical protein
MLLYHLLRTHVSAASDLLKPPGASMLEAAEAASMDDTKKEGVLARCHRGKRPRSPEDGKGNAETDEVPRREDRF